MFMKFLLFCLFIFYSALVSGQESACGADYLHEQLLATEAVYRQKFEENEIRLLNAIERNRLPQKMVVGSDGIRYIPVVVHIVHTGEEIGTTNNPTDAKVEAAIANMNRIFAAEQSFSNSVQIPVKFVLAKRDPDCNPTNGIVRVDGSSVPNYAAKGISITAGATGYANQLDVKNLSRWPHTDYYNIWVVRTIQSYDGFAYYPGASANLDGTVVRVSAINNPNTTLAHELGHAFNLMHTFEGDNNGASCPPGTGDCLLTGDRVCDTEPHKRPSGCPTDPNPCTGASYNNTQYNIMNYSNCKNRFTPGQRERFVAAFELRNSLVNSKAIYPPENPLVAACIPVRTNTSDPRYIGITRVTLNRIDFSSAAANTEGAYLDKTCSQSDSLLQGLTYTITVRTGSEMNNVRAWIDYNNNGVFESAERILSNNGIASFEAHTGTFTVPPSALKGIPLRMRVVTDVGTNINPQACGPFEAGQAEDYTVYINEIPDQFGILEESSDSVCYGGTGPIIGFTQLPQPAALSYQWYYKSGSPVLPLGADTLGWTRVDGAVNPSYQVPNDFSGTRAYACLVTTSQGAGWAAGLNSVTFLPAPSTGVLSGTFTVMVGMSPGNISMYPQPAGDKAYAYQWYSKNGLAAAPGGAPPAGYTLIPGATNPIYDPGPINENMTYAVYVTPLGNPACGTAGWAQGVRQYSTVFSYFDTGKLAALDTTICYGVTPDSIRFARLPEGRDYQPGSGSAYQFHWYYKLGINDCPGGSNTQGWTRVQGVSGNSLYPGPQTENRTYAAFLSLGLNEGAWVEGCVKYTVMPEPSWGKVLGSNDTVCSGFEPADIILGELPGGSGEYSYQWFYKSGNVACPLGDNRSGWTELTDESGTSLKPAPAESGTRTYALFLTPTGYYACGVPQWSEGCAKVTTLDEIKSGTIETALYEYTGGGDPPAHGFIVMPTGATEFNYQWYSKAGLHGAPTGNSTGGWAAVSGATSASFDPPYTSASVTYACFVSPTDQLPCEASAWASGSIQVKVEAIQFSAGLIEQRDYYLCEGDTLPAIGFEELPSGNINFTYKWYYHEGIAAMPSDEDTLNWIALENAREAQLSGFNPGGTVTLRCRLFPEGAPAVWAAGLVRVHLLPELNYGAISAGEEVIAPGADPDPIWFDTAPEGAGAFSYQWYMAEGLLDAPGGDPDTPWVKIDGVTDSVYDPEPLSTSMTFACRVFPEDPACGADNWAEGVKWIRVDNTISIREPEYQTIRIRPNPMGTNGEISFELPAGVKNAEIAISGSDGRLVDRIVVSGRGEVLLYFSPQKIAAGIYFVELRGDGMKMGAAKMLVP